MQIGGVGVEVEVDLGVGEVLGVLGRDLTDDVVGQLGLTSSGGTDDQGRVTHVEEVVDEFLGGDGFSGRDGEGVHLMVLLRVEIDDFDLLGPFFEPDLVSRLVDVIVEDTSLLGEFDAGFPFALPPLGEVLSVVHTVFFGESSSAGPDPGEHEDVLDVLAVLGNQRFQHSAQ